jgi:Phage P22-like portal protein/LAGLIDADG-like domain
MSLDPDFDAIKNDDVFLEAQERMKLSLDGDVHNREKAKAAMLFREGENHWDNDYVTSASQQTPELVINLTDTLAGRVVNSIADLETRGKCHPVADGADTERADVINGLGRHVEYRSDAPVAYDNGTDNAVTGGWGWWRLLGEWAAQDSFDKEIRIAPVFDCFTVYPDPGAIMPTAQDMRWCLIALMQKRSEFKRLNPGVDIVPWNDIGSSRSQSDWETKDEIRVAQYFRILDKNELLYQLQTPDGKKYGCFKSDLPNRKQLFRIGAEIIGEREGTRSQVQLFHLNGEKVVQREILPGTFIPVIRVQGNARSIDGKIYRRGMIETMMDPQRMVDYGEPLALDTPIATPSGWSSIGKVSIGDEVFDESGKPAAVVGMSPTFIHRECFRISFNNGDSVVADADHKWSVEGRRYAKRSDCWDNEVLPTKDLIAGKHFIRSTDPIDCAEADLPIPAYMLGVWLGDGTAVTGQITQSKDDIEEMRGLVAAPGYRIGAARAYGWRAPNFTIHGLRKRLSAAGLLGSKRIPASYLRGSLEQRLSLLQGLMDTDGSISTEVHQCEFGTTLPALAEDVSELLASLGILSKKVVRASSIRVYANGSSGEAKEFYRFTFTCTHLSVFRLKRKAALQRTSGIERRTRRHRIVSIEPCESVPVRCLMVDTPTHLFLVGKSMIPTHNTAKILRLGLATKSKYIAAEGQLDGHPEWTDSNVEPIPTLTYKPVTVTTANGEELLPPPQPIPPAQVEAGFTEFVQGMRSNLLAIAGMPNEPGQDQGNGQTVSGRALQRRDKLSDQSHSQYYKNKKLAVAHTWRIMLEWFPHYYSEERMQRIIGGDGKPQMVKLNEQMMDADGVASIKNDLSVGRYDVVMEAGPSYETMREQGAESLLELMGSPPIAELITKTGPDLLMRSMDFEYAEELADRLAAQTPEGLKKIMESLPKEARAVVQSLSAQNQQLKQALDEAQKEIKYGLAKAHLAATVKAHDVEEGNATKRADTASRERTELTKARMDGHIKLAVEEIAVGGSLLNTHVEAAHNKEAAEIALKTAEKAETSNGAA